MRGSQQPSFMLSHKCVMFELLRDRHWISSVSLLLFVSHLVTVDRLISYSLLVRVLFWMARECLVITKFAFFNVSEHSGSFKHIWCVFLLLYCLDAPENLRIWKRNLSNCVCVCIVNLNCQRGSLFNVTQSVGNQVFVINKSRFGFSLKACIFFFYCCSWMWCMRMF